MKACVTTLKRRRSGSISRSETIINSDMLRMGRATDCEVFLEDMRVSLHAARIFVNDGNVIVEASGETTLTLNDRPTRVASVKVGDKFSIGPYDFELVTPSGDADLAIDMEFVRPMEEGEGAIRQKSVTRLSQTWLSRRRFAWAAFLIVFISLFALPYMQISGVWNAPPADTSTAMPDSKQEQTLLDKIHMGGLWASGELSDAHKFLNAKCETCHQGPFLDVGNKVCLGCHTEVENHADPLLFVSSSPQARGCVSCHKEHHGADGITPEAQALCTTCHADMTAVEPSSDLLNASDFGDHHPDFRPTITIDGVTGETARLIVDEAGNLGEQSNLKFSHQQHLRHDMYYPGTTKSLECASCHIPEFGGETFRPIKMQGTCDTCHKLAFDANRPDRGLPHGDVELVRAALKEFYQSIALEGTYSEKPPVTHGAGRRSIGSDDSKAQPIAAVSGSPTTLKWAKAKALAAEELVFGGQVCGTCHTVSKSGTADAPEWHVLPVKLNTNFLPKANFDHSRHETLGCKSCHLAEESSKSTDLLLPGIETCRTCHAGEGASDKVPSTCTDCHDYHVDGMHPMAGHNGMMQPFGASSIPKMSTPQPASPAN